MSEYTISKVYPSDKRAISQIKGLLEKEGITLDANLDYICGMYDEDYNIMKIEQDMRSLIDNPNTVWIEIPYNSKIIADGLYVIDSENYLYTIIYNGEIVLSFS